MKFHAIKYAFALFFLLIAPTVLLGGYFEEYRQCLIGACPGDAQAACRELANQRERSLGRLTSNMAGLITSIPCQVGDLIYLGNGTKVDATTCGARRETPECQETGLRFSMSSRDPMILQNSCQSLDISNISGDGQPLTQWSRDCNFTGRSCVQCGPRESQIEGVSRIFRAGVEKLLSCFSSSGPYPQPRLFGALSQKYMELAAGSGITLTCPNDNVITAVKKNYHPAATASSSNATIAVYNRTLNAGRPGESVMGHEFMHLLGGDLHPIDNQDSHTHNNPHFHHHHSGDGEAEVMNTPNIGGLPNSFNDRVYACERLCFPDKRITKEQCELCLGYRTSPISSALARKCRKLISNSDMNDLMVQMEISDADIRDMCTTQYNHLYERFKTSISQEDVRFSYNSITFGNSKETERLGIRWSLSGADTVHGTLSLWNLTPPAGLNHQSSLAVGSRHPRELREERIRQEAPSASGSSRLSPRVVSSTNPSYSEVERRCGEAYTDGLRKVQEIMERYPQDEENSKWLKQKQVDYGYGAKKFQIKHLCNQITVFNSIGSKCREILPRVRREYSREFQSATSRVCGEFITDRPGTLLHKNVRPLLISLRQKSLEFNCLLRDMQSQPSYAELILPDELNLPRRAEGASEDCRPDGSVQSEAAAEDRSVATQVSLFQAQSFCRNLDDY